MFHSSIQVGEPIKNISYLNHYASIDVVFKRKINGEQIVTNMVKSSLNHPRNVNESTVRHHHTPVRMIALPKRQKTVSVDKSMKEKETFSQLMGM